MNRQVFDLEINKSMKWIFKICKYFQLNIRIPGESKKIKFIPLFDWLIDWFMNKEIE